MYRKTSKQHMHKALAALPEANGDEDLLLCREKLNYLMVMGQEWKIGHFVRIFSDF